MRLGMFDPDELQPFRKFDHELVDTPEHRVSKLRGTVWHWLSPQHGTGYGTLISFGWS